MVEMPQLKSISIVSGPAVRLNSSKHISDMYSDFPVTYVNKDYDTLNQEISKLVLLEVASILGKRVISTNWFDQ